MKTSKFFLLSTVVAMTLVACKPESNVQTTVVDFEGVTLNADSIWNGSDLSGSFVSQNAVFNNVYNSQWFSWSGFACSAKTDTKTPGYANQYSSIAGSGALNSKKYAVAYGTASFTCKPNQYGNFNIQSLMLTNSTYAYLDMQTGTPGVSKKFADGDWFKIIFNGYLNKLNTGKVEYYLADFRNGKSFMANTWNKLDVSTLGKVDSVAISFDSSDTGQWGINTPTYVCIDNITFTQTINNK